MHACPKCGGADAHEIAPGYYQCESTDSDGDRCHNRYQAGAQAHNHLCQCGTFAIGRCVDCGDWICGDHSSLEERDRICKNDQEKRRKAEDQREQATLKTVQDFLGKMAQARNRGAQKLGKTKDSGWIIACGAKGHTNDHGIVWFALLTDGTFRQVFPSDKTVFEGRWTSPQGKMVGVSPNDVGLHFPYGDIYIPAENQPLELLDAVARRLDAICLEHGLGPVSH